MKYLDQVMHQTRLEPDGTTTELRWTGNEFRFVEIKKGQVTDR